MNNFGRAIRMVLRYRWTFAASVICALGVALTWGGNISTIYPVFEVVFQGKSLGQWAEAEQQAAAAAAGEITAEIVRLQQALPQAAEAERKSLETQERIASARLVAEQKAEQRYARMAPWLNKYFPAGAFSTLALMIALLLLGTVIKSVFFVLNTVLIGRMTNLAVFDLRKRFYRHTLKMQLAAFGNGGANELMTRFTHDVDALAGGLRNLFGKAVREPLKMIACLAGAGMVCWRLLLLTMIVAPPAAWMVSRLAKSLKKANRRAMENMSQVYGILDETFQGIKVVKAFTMERQERRRFHQNSKSFYRWAMKINWYDGLTRPVTEMVGMVTICLALLAGAYLVLEGQTHLLGIKLCDRPLSRSSLLLFYGLLAGVSDPARKLSEVFNSLQRAAAAADRIFAMLDRAPTIVDPLQPIALDRHHRDLLFEGVHFSYVPNVPVLENINLRIPFGETIAVVGPNGCGKSTLVNLIPRFMDPTSGVVRLDGVDLHDVRLRELRQQIGLVTQETLLFNDTVFNNIRYGSPNATHDEVIQAAKQAHAHRFITERLEKGYDTLVGQRGGSLSGGQRQRIALARAILRDPAILILDEATSQIDLESEQVIQQVLEQFVRNRTTFIITHRLGAIRLANRVLVMDAGRVLDFGTHDELMRRCPLYARLNALDFQENAA